MHRPCRLVCQRVWMSERRKLSGGKKTRQRRGNGCRGGRDAVGVAAKGRRSIWRQGRVWQGKEGNFRKTGWNGNQVRAILSRFSDLEPPPLLERNSFLVTVCFYTHRHTHSHIYPKSLSLCRHARNLKEFERKKCIFQ